LRTQLKVAVRFFRFLYFSTFQVINYISILLLHLK
jgi:hypothetical protein